MYVYGVLGISVCVCRRYLSPVCRCLNWKSSSFSVHRVSNLFSVFSSQWHRCNNRNWQINFCPFVGHKLPVIWLINVSILGSRHQHSQSASNRAASNRASERLKSPLKNLSLLQTGSADDQLFHHLSQPTVQLCPAVRQSSLSALAGDRSTVWDARWVGQWIIGSFATLFAPSRCCCRLPAAGVRVKPRERRRHCASAGV